MRNNCVKCSMIIIIAFFVTVLFQHNASAESDAVVAVESRQQGVVWQNKGDFRKALYYYERALTLLPGNAAICNDVGLMQDVLGKNTEAEKSYLKAIQFDAGYLPAYNNLGLFYSKQGQYVLAAKYLRQRVNMGRPQDEWTLKAQEELMKVYKMAPSLEAERIRSEADLFSKDIVNAKDRMKRSAVRHQSLNFEMAYQKGIECFDSGNFDEAIGALETAVILDPRNNSARQALKRAQFGKEKRLLEAKAKELKEESKNRSVAEALANRSSR